MRDDDQMRRDIRAWATRPPERSPQAARTRVLARLDERRRPAWRLAAAATTAAVALMAVLLLHEPETPTGPPIATLDDRPTAGLLVYELASGTKLYLALPPSTALQSRQGENG